MTLQSLHVKLSVIVLFHYGDRWIDTCIQSLEDQTLSRDRYEIILVDNGGSTPSTKRYEGKKNLQVIHFPANYGFAGGNNRALDYAKGEMILLMNQDVVVHSHCLKEMLDAFGNHPEAGAISANMLMVSAHDVIERNSRATSNVGLFKLTRFGYASYYMTDTYRDVVPVDFVSGNALCFRRTILKDLGNYLFDSRLGSYAEDLDLSLRLNKSEWKMYVRPKAIIYHYRDNAFSGKPTHMLNKLVHISGNRLMVYYNNLATGKFLKKLPALLIGIPFKVARLDGERRFNLSRFIAALGVSPLVVVNFLLKVIVNKKVGSDMDSDRV